MIELPLIFFEAKLTIASSATLTKLFNILKTVASDKLFPPSPMLYTYKSNTWMCSLLNAFWKQSIDPFHYLADWQ